LNFLYVPLPFLHDAIDILFGGISIPWLQRACCIELRAENIMRIWTKLFFLFSFARFAALSEVSGKKSYGVERLLLSVVDYGAHCHDWTSERWRGTLTEGKRERGGRIFLEKGTSRERQIWKVIKQVK
jgi:hypothetical protein